MPADFAISFAKGDAKIRDESCVSELGAISATGSLSATAAFISVFDASVVAALPPPIKFSNASPASPMTTNGAPTNIFPFSGTPMCNKTPVLGLSKSIVALSELISANSSPF